MTIHNTHHEHDDVNESVVESQHVPEGMTTPSTPEVPKPDEGTQIQAGLSASDELPATPAEPQAETSSETLAVSEAPAPSVAESQVAPELVSQNSHNSEATSVSDVNPEQITLAPTEEAVITSSDDKSPLTTVEGDEGHTRPFIDFIEEFRLAEEARLSASRQEIATESSFELLTSAPISEEPSIVSEGGLFSLTSAASAEPTSSNEEAPTSQEDVSSAAFTTPTPEKVDINLSGQQALAEESTQEQSTPATPPERAVSPLLRPATRLRIPRHGARHVREESIAEKALSTPSASNVPTTSEQLGQVTSPETVTEPEPPRPPRRYRFDRPASAANGSTSAAPVQITTPQRAEESKENIQNRGSQIVQNGSELQNDGASATSAPVKAALNIESTPVIIPSIEPPLQKQIQEAPITEGTSAPQVIEHSRRHSGQERQKEQPVTATTTDTVTPTAEIAAQSGVVAPEDLPPLEYSELQKASTRRRRRHRTSSSNGSTAATPSIEQVVAPPVQPPPAVPSLPAALVAPVAPAVPPAPVASPALAEAISNQYSIVSGYTVSQMNMGNEAAGPFMGPEPSPARGSLVTREGRTTRAEAQRAPIYTPGRTHETAPSSTSLNHFASVISQAIQTQTDRMVAELRRNSQSPTNVSVSLPPFPSTERVGVFVDVANLLYSARTLRMAVDFGKLLDFLRGNRRLVRAHAYCPTSPQAGDEQMFLQAVKGLGYRITTKNYKTFSSGAKKADLDLDLCMDVVRLVDGRAVDCVVLVSGDSDFMPMLDYCSDHGVRVEVAAFDEAMSATLRQSCDLFINLSMLEEIRS